ncbi:MAG: RNA-binding domain-containing protein [Candidatus Woesearchaeota archaeon]
MQPPFLYIQFRIISFPGDSVDQLRALLQSLVPLDFKKEQLQIEEQVFTDQFDNKRFILTLSLQKTRHIRACANELFPSQVRNSILETLDSRIDEGCHLYIRYKKDALLETRFLLTDGGNCVHLTFAVASYPKKRDIACQAVEKYLKAFDV